MIPLIILAVVFGYVAYEYGKTPRPGMAGEFRPNPNDVVVVRVNRPGAHTPAIALSSALNDEIAGLFGRYGYQVNVTGAQPTNLEDSVFKPVLVLSKRSDVGLPAALGPGLTIVAVQGVSAMAPARA